MNSRPLPYQGSALPLSYNGIVVLAAVTLAWRTAANTSVTRAEDEVRTRDLQLGRLSLYQLSYFRMIIKNFPFPHYFVGEDGFEPPNSEEDRFTVCCRWPLGYSPAPLHLSRVVVFSKFDSSRLKSDDSKEACASFGAREGTRTPDQLITNQLLYQLSYSG